MKSAFVKGKAKQNTAKLIKALESGKYKHTTNYLELRKGHNCCLGVACRMDGLNAYAAGVTQFTFPSGMTETQFVSAAWWEQLFGMIDTANLADLNDESDTGYAPVIKHLKAVNARRK